MNRTYLLEINYTDGEKEQIELTTDRLEWSMYQYQRNRKTFNWRIIKE